MWLVVEEIFSKQWTRQKLVPPTTMVLDIAREAMSVFGLVNQEYLLEEGSMVLL